MTDPEVPRQYFGTRRLEYAMGIDVHRIGKAGDREEIELELKE
jgi:hypothetical protein